METRQFEKFLLSPYFNHREDVCRLLLALKDAKNGQIDLNSSKIFERIWPNSKFNEKRLRHTMSFLLDLIQQFLVHQSVKTDTGLYLKSLAHILDQRRLNQHFDQVHRRLVKVTDEMTHSANKLHLNYDLEQLRKENQFRREKFETQNITNTSQALDDWYLLEKLRILIEAESLASRQTMEVDIRFGNDILRLLQEHREQLTPLVRLYLLVHEVLTSDGELRAFEQARSLLIGNEKDLAHKHLRELYLLTINYGIKQMNRGKDPFFKETLELYKSGLSNGALLENGLLSSNTYKNINAIALRLKEFDWALAYLQEYKSALPAKKREQIYNYNMAIYHFTIRDFDKFIDLASHLKSRDIHLNCDLRRMYAIMFFEEGDKDVLEHHLKSFKAYLIRHRGKLSYHFYNWNQFIRTMSKFVRAETSKEKISSLRAEIKGLDHLSSKDWFLEQLAKN